MSDNLQYSEPYTSRRAEELEIIGVASRVAHCHMSGYSENTDEEPRHCWRPEAEETCNPWPVCDDEEDGESGMWKCRLVLIPGG